MKSQVESHTKPQVKPQMASQNMSSDASSRSEGGQESRSEGRTEERSEARSDAGLQTKSMATLGDALTVEGRENLEQLFADSKSFFSKARNYIEENPREAAAVALTGIGVAWFFASTKPGRRAFESVRGMATPILSEWVAKTFKPVQTH